MRIIHGTVRFLVVMVAATLAAAGVIVAAPSPTTDAPRTEMSVQAVDLTAAAATMPTAAPAAPEALAAGIAAAVGLGMFDGLAPAPGRVCLTCIGILVDGVVRAIDAGAGGFSAGFTRTLHATATLGAIAAATGIAVTTTLTEAVMDAVAQFEQSPGRACFGCLGATLVGGVSDAVNEGLIGLASGVSETADAVTDLGAIAANTGQAINEALTSAVLTVLGAGEEPPPGDYCLGCIEFVRGISAAVDTGLAGMAAGVAMAARAVAALSVAAASTAIAINDAVSGAIQDALRALGGAEPSTDPARAPVADNVDVSEDKSPVTPSRDDADDPRSVSGQTAATEGDESREDRESRAAARLDEKEIADAEPKSTDDDDASPTPKDEEPVEDGTKSTAKEDSPADKDDEEAASKGASSAGGDSSTNDADSDAGDSTSSSRAAAD